LKRESVFIGNGVLAPSATLPGLKSHFPFQAQICDKRKVSLRQKHYNGKLLKKNQGISVVADEREQSFITSEKKQSRDWKH
jgi:hypothetical protein